MNCLGYGGWVSKSIGRCRHRLLGFRRHVSWMILKLVNLWMQCDPTAECVESRFSGWDWVGWRLARPLKFRMIRHVKFHSGHPPVANVDGISLAIKSTPDGSDNKYKLSFYLNPNSQPGLIPHVHIDYSPLWTKYSVLQRSTRSHLNWTPYSD